MPQTTKPKIELWPLSRPIPYARNARIVPDEAVSKVAGSIHEFGFKNPILVDAGPVAAQDYAIVPPSATPSEVWRETLFPLGLRLLAGVLRDAESGRVAYTPQDEALATWEPSWERPPLHRPELWELPPVGGFGSTGGVEFVAEADWRAGR